MRKSTAINLELAKGEDLGVKFYAKQFDDLKLNVKVFDGLEEVNVDGQDIIVCIIKEDKTVIEQTKDITIEDNTIVIKLSKQATTALGKCSMEILLRDEEGTASTSTISYLVSEKLSASIVEMIKSEDDINALNLIEEFIETSNVDMIEIKEALKELKDTVDGVQGNIDAEYESIIETLRALEGTIIGNIEGKANEALTKADEAVTKATEALETITEAKAEVDNIDNKVTTALSEINTAKTDSLEAIKNNANGVANDLNTLSDTLKADIANTGLLENNKIVNSKEDALVQINNLKDNAISSLGEEALKVEEALNITVAEIKKQAETDLEGLKTALINYANTLKESTETDLNASKDAIIGEVNTLKEQVDSSLASLSEKVVESDSNIEELTALIAEAKEVAGLVRAFIDSYAIDLSNYYTKEETDNRIDEKIGLIEIPNIDLSGYYTREEVNELLIDKVGEFGNIPLTQYDTFPLTKHATKPSGYDWYIEYKDTGGDYWTVFFNKNPEGFIVLNTDLEGKPRYVINTEELASSNAKIYKYSSSWSSNSTFPPYGMNIGNTSRGIAETYYHNFNILDEDGNIARHNYEDNLKPGTTNDFDKATEFKTYIVSTKEGDGIQNAPIPNIEGMLINDKAYERIKQELVMNDNSASYKRVFDGSGWSNWRKEITEDDLAQIFKELSGAVTLD